jgi:hypothetical protein
MRRLTALCALLFLTACPGMDFGGNSSSLDVEIENQYSESIFTIETSTEEDGDRTKVFDEERIQSFEKSRKSDAVTIPESGELWFFVSATSLGETNRLEPFRFKLEKGKNVLFAYDFDLATATFRMKANYDFIH